MPHYVMSTSTFTFVISSTSFFRGDKKWEQNRELKPDTDSTSNS